MTETVVPDTRHHQIARRLARRSRIEGAEAVLAEVEDLMWDDVPFVAVALARMAWAGPHEPKPKPTRLPGITDDARAAHALFERFRKLGGEIPMCVREGEREYQAMRYRAKRDQGRNALSARENGVGTVHLETQSGPAQRELPGPGRPTLEESGRRG